MFSLQPQALIQEILKMMEVVYTVSTSITLQVNNFINIYEPPLRTTQVSSHQPTKEGFPLQQQLGAQRSSGKYQPNLQQGEPRVERDQGTDCRQSGET